MWGSTQMAKREQEDILKQIASNIQDAQRHLTLLLEDNSTDHIIQEAQEALSSWYVTYYQRVVELLSNEESSTL